MASFTRDGIGKDDAHHFLGLAVAWKQAAEALAAAEQAHAPILGTYYRGPATDFSQLEAALAVAAIAVRRARGQDLNRFADCRVPPVIAKAAADISHLTSLSGQFSDTFGRLYGGEQTDMASVRSALEWARRLRATITGADAPLTLAQLGVLGDAIPAANPGTAADAWNLARDGLLEAFCPDRRQDLATELDDYGEASDLIAVLRQDTGGKDEWHAYQEARALLAAHGLDIAVDFCISERVPSGQVPAVIERALLTEWAEYHLRTDPGLAVVRATDRDTLVREYQDLDRALISAATGTIIRACNARRPRSDIGESAIIHREAEKKRKHMPVRTLLERSRHVAQAIKPCFMMSPLAVSQFLPADMHFNVVVFDEASQVSPGDAINCIYRGSALILAGDGWTRRGPDITARLHGLIDRLLAAGTLTGHADNLTPAG